MQDTTERFYWDMKDSDFFSNDAVSYDYLDVARSLAVAIRRFVKSYDFTDSAFKVDIYQNILTHAKAKYPNLFLNIDGVNGDMDDNIAVHCRNSQSDKFDPHGYYRYYSRYVNQYIPLVNKSPNKYAMLEIGIQRGLSVQMWLDVFSHHIFVFGLDDQLGTKGDKYEIFKADQSIKENMMYVYDQIQSSSSRDIFLIVDDGSHHPQHQVDSFDYFFSELLLPGGTYIIEDIETSYWRHLSQEGTSNYGYKHPKSAIESFKYLADDINYEFLWDEDREKQDKLLHYVFSEKTRRLVSSVTFGHNCIIIVKKSLEETVVFSDRLYRVFETVQVCDRVHSLSSSHQDGLNCRRLGTKKAT